MRRYRSLASRAKAPRTQPPDGIAPNVPISAIFSRVEKEIAEISQLRDYTRRLTPTDDQTLSGVVGAINILLAEVAARDEKLRDRLDDLTDARDDAQTTNFLLKRVKDELQSRKRELDEALARAAQASSAKSQFLANMSHEIRTPMNGILGMAELLSRSTLEQKQRQQVATIVQSGRALLTIINDILDFSKIESGRLDFDNKPFDLKSSIDDVAALLTPNAERKKIKIAVDADPALPRMYIGDAGRVRQIITNIMGNSVKFTEKGQVSIKLTGRVEGETAHLRIEIIDTGIGIPAEKVPAVFEKFSQVDGTSTRRHEGTGLGLSICKLLIEHMGGRIGLTSTFGVGSTFWVEMDLPVHREASAKPKTAAISLRGRNVLLLQAGELDHPPLENQLTGLGCKTYVVPDVAAAEALIAAVTSTKFDLAIVSAGLADETSIRDVARLRDIKCLAGLPAILLSSIGSPGDGKNVFDAGIQGFLTRPLSTDGLGRAMSAVLENAAAGASELVTKHSVNELAAPAAATAAQQVRRVLLVEDSLVNQEVAREFLDGIDCTVTVANNGAEAVKAIAEGAFDVVLMDCQMPVMDGFEATRIIREQEAKEGRRPLPIIALTANAFASDREKCAAAGMSDFLSKPFMPDEFETIVQKWLAASAA